MRRSSFVLLSIALLFAMGSAAFPTAQPHTQSLEAVIVVFDDTVSDSAQVARELARAHDARLGYVYQHALKGFSAEVPSSRLAALQRDPRVSFVEPDQVAHTFDQTVPTGIERIFAPDNPNIGIDGTDDLRIDVDVAVIDTGIDLDHADLNVVASTNCSGGSPFSQSCGSGGDDDNGHGTHVAGTIGAIDNGIGVVGVAPGARLWSVKVLRSDGSGYISWIVAGIDYVTANAAQIEIANMSLGCECSSAALDTAITNSVAAGVAYAVAAGNSAKDASTFSPANHPDVLTVSALADFDGLPGGLGSPTCRNDEDDTLANFSNFGPLIDIAAPGVCILSTWNDGGYNTISGTSMASPHAAGALGLLASGANAPSDKTGVLALYASLESAGNFDWTDDSGDGIQEPLLDVSDTTLFDPATVEGGGGDDGGGGDGGDDGTAGDFPLEATGYKVRGLQKADLTWSGATSDNVDIYRNGTKIDTTANDGSYTDHIDLRGSGSYTYQVCEEGTSTCSNEATVNF